MEVVGGPHGLTDRGSGKAAQLVAVDGEIKQLVEVKLNVVQPDRPRNIDATCDPIALEYKDNSDDVRNFKSDSQHHDLLRT